MDRAMKRASFAPLSFSPALRPRERWRKWERSRRTAQQPYRSIRLKTKEVRGSHEVARRKNPGDFGLRLPGTKSSQKGVDRGGQMVLANRDRHQLVEMSLACWRRPD